MIIGVDGNEANVKNRVGVNVYAFELLRSIYQLQKGKVKKTEFLVYLNSAPLPDMPPQSDFWKYIVLPNRRLWVITRLMPHLFSSFLSEKGLDLFFTPSHYAPPLLPMPKICSIMDLGYLEFSDQFRKYDYWQLRLWTAWSIVTSKAVITISNASKRDIVRRYPQSRGKTRTTLLAYDKKKFHQIVTGKKEIKKKYRIPGNYLLFLSTLKPSKNIQGLVRAWSMVESKHPSTTLVIAGKKGWLYADIFDSVRELGLVKRVIFTDFIPEEDKPALIAGAKCFVLPSFWEGFGLDVLNAFGCGVPVIASSRGSLSEVVGNAGILFDPEDTRNLASAIEKVLSMNKKEYNKMVTKGLAQAKHFSWKKTARQTLRIFESIIK